MNSEEMKQIIDQATELREKSSNSLLWNSLSSLKPAKFTGYLRFFLTILFSLIISIILCVTSDTISKLIKIVDTLNTIDLALLGIVFTGFTLFQGILKKDLLKTLLLANKKPEKSSTAFVKVDREFYYLMTIYFTNVFVNVLLLLFLNSVTVHFSLDIPNTYNEIIATILITIYVAFNCISIYEMKFFVYNISSLFNLNVEQNMVLMFKQTPARSENKEAENEGSKCNCSCHRQKQWKSNSFTSGKQFRRLHSHGLFKKDTKKTIQ